MRHLLHKVYNFIWRNSVLTGGLLILAYIGMLFLNITGWEPASRKISLLGVEIIPLLVASVMFYLVYSHISQISSYRKKQKEKDAGFALSIWDIPRGMFIKAIASCMGLMWSMGWILYTCALWSNYRSDGNYAEILGYAAMASLDLFMMDINGNVLDNINGGAEGPNLFPWPRLLKGALVLVSILSALCTFVILINLFFSRFAAYLHSKLVKVTPKSNNHIYIFKGTGDKQQRLAKSIAEEDPRHLIVFVDIEDSGDSDEIDGWDKVIRHLTLRNPVASKMNQNNHGIFLMSEGSIADFNSADLKDLSPSEFWARLGLKRIDSLLNELNNNKPDITDTQREEDIENQVHFFFLSEDRDRNISEANVVSDKMKETGYDNLKVSIYASGRKDSVISIIEDKEKPDNQTIRVIDDSRLSVDVLKRNEESHPIRFVDLDLTHNPGTVASPFNALILGFGETGRDALRYLYEFSAFIDSSSKDNHRSPVKIQVVDPEVNTLSGKFLSDRPGLNTTYNIQSNGGEPIIGFLPMDVRSTEFYQYIKNAITDLNYIVVALGEDELNVTVATQLVKYARQYRPTLDKFKILIRVYNDDSFSHFDDVINHYNQKLEVECGIGSILQAFGSVEEVYTYGLIVRDNFAVAGKNYDDSYYAYYEKVSARENQKKQEMGDIQPERPLSAWEKKDKRKFGDFENLQNAIHALTKEYIIETFLKKETSTDSTSTRALWENLFTRFDVTPEGIDTKRSLTPEVVNYKEASKISPKFDRLLTNLAVTEHLRWNASHEMLGFVHGPEKNFRIMTHPCLRSWDELPKISETNALRVYDYLVVETTLFLKKSKLEEEAKNKEEEESKKEENKN